MSKLKRKARKWFENYKKGFFNGLGFSFGATIGLAIISSLLVFSLSKLGGLPLIGNWIASLVQATQSALVTKGL